MARRERRASNEREACAHERALERKRKREARTSPFTPGGERHLSPPKRAYARQRHVRDVTEPGHEREPRRDGGSDRPDRRAAADGERRRGLGADFGRRAPGQSRQARFGAREHSDENNNRDLHGGGGDRFLEAFGGGGAEAVIVIFFALFLVWLNNNHISN